MAVALATEPEMPTWQEGKIPHLDKMIRDLARRVARGELSVDHAVQRLHAKRGGVGHGPAAEQYLRYLAAKEEERHRRYRKVLDQYGAQPVDWATATVGTQPPWDCEPLILRNRGQYLCAAENTGKSFLALEASVRMATGEQFLLKERTEPLRVAYFDFERSQETMLLRLRNMGLSWATGLEGFLYLDSSQLARVPRLHQRKGGKYVHAQAADHGANVVVIDSYARATGAERLNDGETPTAFYGETVERLLGEGMSVLWLTHTGWNDTTRLSGSRQQAAVAGYGGVLSAEGNRLRLKVTKDNEANARSPVYFIDRKDDPLRHEVGDGLTPGERDLVARIRADNCPPLSTRKAEERYGVSHKIAVRAIRHLRDTEEMA